MKRLLLNNLPLWRGQNKIGVKYGPCLLNTLTHNIVNNRYFIQNNFLKSKNLNNFDLSTNIPYLKNYITHLLENSKRDDLILNLGGDHAISIATIPPMLKKYPNLKVIWIDAHADINSPNESLSGNVHGMPIHYISTLHSDGAENKLLLDNLIYVGVRDVDYTEKLTLNRHKIRNYTKEEIDKIDKRGIEIVVNEMMIEKELLNNPIHISLDIDGLDPEYCPSTGTKAENGLNVYDVVNLCKRIKQTGNLVSIDLVEFNPLIGSDSDVDKTLHNIKKILEVVL